MEIAQSEMGYSQSKFTCANIATANTALRVSVLYAIPVADFCRSLPLRCSTTRFSSYISPQLLCQSKSKEKACCDGVGLEGSDPKLAYFAYIWIGNDRRTNGCHRRSPVEPCPVVKDRRLADALKQTNSAVRGRGTEFRRFHANTCGCRQGQDANTPPDRHRRLSPVK